MRKRTFIRFFTMLISTAMIVSAFSAALTTTAAGDGGITWYLYNETNGNTVFNVENDAEKGEVIHASRARSDVRLDCGAIDVILTGLTIGGTYSISYDVKTASDENGFVQSLVWNAKPNLSSTDNWVYSDLISTGGNWQRYTQTFVANQTDCDFKLLINSAYVGMTGTFEAWFANINLKDATYKAPVGATFTGWTKVDDNTNFGSLCTTDSSDGDGVCALIPANGDAIQYRFGPFLTEGTYKISYDIKSVSEATYSQVLIQGTQGYLWDSATCQDIISHEWKNFTGTFTVDSGLDIQRMVVYPKAGCYIDNISVTDANGKEYVYNGNFYSNASASGVEVPNSEYCNFVNGGDAGYLYISPRGTSGNGVTYENKFILPNQVQIGESYTLSFEATATSLGGSLGVHINNCDNVWTDFHDAFSGANGWTTKSITFVPNETTQWFTLYTYGFKSIGDCVYIRNISVKDSNGNEYMGDTEFLARGTADNLMPVNGTSAQNVTLKGDINEDGTVNLKDLIRAKKVIAATAETYAARNCDLDKNKSLDADDLSLLRRFLLGTKAVLN